MRHGPHARSRLFARSLSNAGGALTRFANISPRFLQEYRSVENVVADDELADEKSRVPEHLGNVDCEPNRARSQRVDSPHAHFYRPDIGM